MWLLHRQVVACMTFCVTHIAMARLKLMSNENMIHLCQNEVNPFYLFHWTIHITFFCIFCCSHCMYRIWPPNWDTSLRPCAPAHWARIHLHKLMWPVPPIMNHGVQWSQFGSSMHQMMAWWLLVTLSPWFTTGCLIQHVFVLPLKAPPSN